jgi:3-phenylpropionate/cinnamic acid dioxygenase small subunit
VASAARSAAMRSSSSSGRAGQGFAERGEQPWHLISNMLIESQSATQAHVRCCYVFATQTVDGLTVHGLSRYFDHFAGSADGWHIRTRRNVVAHLGSRRSAEQR